MLKRVTTDIPEDATFCVEGVSVPVAIYGGVAYLFFSDQRVEKESEAQFAERERIPRSEFEVRVASRAGQLFVLGDVALARYGYAGDPGEASKSEGTDARCAPTRNTRSRRAAPLRESTASASLTSCSTSPGRAIRCRVEFSMPGRRDVHEGHDANNEAEQGDDERGDQPAVCPMNDGPPAFG